MGTAVPGYHVVRVLSVQWDLRCFYSVQKLKTKCMDSACAHCVFRVLTFLDARNSMPLATWKAALTTSVIVNCLSGLSLGGSHVES